MRMSDWSSDVCSSDLGDCRCHVAPFAGARSSEASVPCQLAPFLRALPDRSSAPIPPRAVASSCRSSTAPVASTCTLSRSEEHTSELQSLMRISYAVFCLKKKKKNNSTKNSNCPKHVKQI